MPSLLVFILLSTTYTSFSFVHVDCQHFVSYVDNLAGWSDDLILESIGVPGYCESNSYNVINLSFWNSQLNDATDALLVWSNPTEFFQQTTIDKIANVSNATDDQFRNGLISLYHNDGIKVLASAFGGSDYPTSTHDATQLGKEIATFVKTNLLDGIDIDWEDSPSFESGISVYIICCTIN